jgi:hypothetical protein
MSKIYFAADMRWHDNIDIELTPVLGQASSYFIPMVLNMDTLTETALLNSIGTTEFGYIGRLNEINTGTLVFSGRNPTDCEGLLGKKLRTAPFLVYLLNLVDHTIEAMVLKNDFSERPLLVHSYYPDKGSFAILSQTQISPKYALAASEDGHRMVFLEDALFPMSETDVGLAGKNQRLIFIVENGNIMWLSDVEGYREQEVALSGDGNTIFVTLQNELDKFILVDIPTGRQTVVSLAVD